MLLYVYFFVYFSVRKCSKNILIVRGKLYEKKRVSQPRLICRYFKRIFTKCFSTVMYVAINKQFISFQNRVFVLARLCQQDG